MGLAASQARYLTLTARKSDLEFQSQTINSRRIQLSYKTAEIARAYSEGMNNKRIQMQVPGVSTSGQATKVWKEISFDLLKKQGFMIIGTQGTALKPSPYIVTGQGEEKLHNLKEAYSPIDTDKKDEELAKNKTAHKLSASGTITTLSEEDYAKLSTAIKNAGIYEKQGNEYKLKAYISDSAYTAIQSDNTYKTAYASTKTNPLEAAFVKGSDDSSKWTLANQIPDSVYQLLDATNKALYESGTVSNTTYSYKVNPNYTNPDELGPDIQALLVSGKAQIVTKEFMDYLVEHGAYNYEKGLQGGLSFVFSNYSFIIFSVVSLLEVF